MGREVLEKRRTEGLADDDTGVVLVEHLDASLDVSHTLGRR